MVDNAIRYEDSCLTIPGYETGECPTCDALFTPKGTGRRLPYATIRRECEEDYFWDVCIYPDDVNPMVDSFGALTFEDAIIGALELVTKYRNDTLIPA